MMSKMKDNNEVGARQGLLEELFYDFHKTRRQVYATNFFRGVFFGVGSVLGGTLLIAVAIWLLSWLVDLPGGVGDFVQYVVDTVQNR